MATRKKKWPTFVPVDNNATCAVCHKPWDFHGLDQSHCPPCGNEIYECNRSTSWITKVVDHCNKVHGHKGGCGVVKS